MDDRSLVTHLLAIGVAARRKKPDAYATPSDDPNLKNIGAATIATWLEELGRHRLVGDVQPCFTGHERSLLPIRVRKCEPGDLVRGRIYVDLVGLGEDAARERLLKGVAASRIGLRPAGSQPSGPAIYPGRGAVAREEEPRVLGATPSAVQHLRVLFLGAKAGTDLDLDGQLKSMRRAVRAVSRPPRIVFESVLDVTPASLLPAIHTTNPDVCHFSGRQDGGNVLIRSDEGGVVVIPDDALEGLFQSLGPRVQLVVMDTCQSARCAQAITNVVPFALGVTGDAYDKDATTFYSNFYSAVAAGHSLRDASDQARAVSMLNEVQPDEIPQLFVNAGYDAQATCLVKI
jgi:hypothetical protein